MHTLLVRFWWLGHGISLASAFLFQEVSVMRISLAAALFAIVFAGACTESTMSPAQPASLNVPVRVDSGPRAGGSKPSERVPLTR